jgi:hypothetical protein
MSRDTLDDGGSSLWRGGAAQPVVDPVEPADLDFARVDFDPKRKMRAINSEPLTRRIDPTPPWAHHQAMTTRTFHNATVTSRSDFKRFGCAIRSISSRAARLSRSSL